MMMMMLMLLMMMMMMSLTACVYLLPVTACLVSQEGA